MSLAAAREVFITCAVTGAADSVARSDKVPVTPAEIADAAIEAAEAGAAIADFIQYATPNAAAAKLMDDAYRSNPAIFPSEEVIAKCEPSVYQGAKRARLLDEAWTRIQAA